MSESEKPGSIINENTESLLSEIKSALGELKNSNNTENRTKLLKHAETVLSSLSAGKDQVVKLVQDSQQLISNNWNTVTDLRLESEQTKQELEKIKNHSSKFFSLPYSSLKPDMYDIT